MLIISFQPNILTVCQKTFRRVLLFSTFCQTLDQSYLHIALELSDIWMPVTTNQISHSWLIVWEDIEVQVVESFLIFIFIIC